MSAITYIGIDANPYPVSIGNTFLVPLRFCGKQWNTLKTPLEDGNILWKTLQVAGKVIASIGMVFCNGGYLFYQP